MNTISTLQSSEGKPNGQNGADSAIHQARTFGHSTQSEPFQLNPPSRFGLTTAQTPPAPQSFALLDDDTHSEQGSELPQLALAELALASRDISVAPTKRAETAGLSLDSARGLASTDASMARSLSLTASQLSQQPAGGLSDLALSKTSLAQSESMLMQTNSTALLHVTAQTQGQQSTTAPSVLAAPATSQGAEWAAVKIDTGAGKWGEQMMQVLHDRVSLQAQQNMQEAKIRLDPPELGKLDVLVRVDGDRLSVQINANASATREALIQVSERLRAELQNQNFVHVDVNVGSGDAQQHSAPHHQQDGIIFSARDSSSVESSTSQSEHWLNTQA